jgi:primosomal protein N' (replication factor Y)
MSDFRHAAPPLYADIVVPRHLRRLFTYSVPAGMQARLQVGSRVEVPFGSSRLRGVVTNLSSTPPATEDAGRTFRAIALVVDEPDGDLTPELFELSRLLSERYLTPWGQCLRLILPPATAAVRRRPVHSSGNERAPNVQTAAISARDGAQFRTDSAWWERLRNAMDRRSHDALLAVGSVPARTATILTACDDAVRRHRAAIVVLAEINRVNAFAVLARSRWRDRVALLHSALTNRERLESWRRIRHGEISMVIGTRSAVFAPFDERAPIGLVCVDAEEDPALKDEQEPRYHARDVGMLRARRQDAVLLLCSSHPSLEAISSLEPAGIEQVMNAPGASAPVQVVDLRQAPATTILSAPLLEALRRSVQQRTGAILYLNRKGFASALWCRDCGAVPKCDRCSVPLRYYRVSGRAAARDGAGTGLQKSGSQSALACLYCGASVVVPDTCPSCRSARLQPVGFGTARLEDEVQALVPGARILRLDSDTTRKSGDAVRLWRAATVGAFDVLIGTHMLFSGPPIPPAGLVGIPNADAGLHVPDFRSAERTYHALLDACSLSRSAGEGGTVMLQTHLPNHHVVAALARNQPSLFYEHELAFRQTAGYPPFSSLIGLKITGSDSEKVQQAAERWGTMLRASAGRLPQVAVLGPIPATVARLRGRYRWQLLIKADDPEAARQVVKPTLVEIEATTKRGIKFDVDVDPVELV